MSASSQRAGLRASVDPSLLLRPRLSVALICDVVAGLLVYPGVFWLRFQGEPMLAFLPRMVTIGPLLVAAQIVGFRWLGVYSPRPRNDWLTRIVLGCLLGSGVAAALVALTSGFEGVSRLVFAADAVVMSLACIAWRGAWVLHARSRASALASDLIDRREEMTSLRGIVGGLYRYRELLRNLVLKDLKLKYRGSVFGFLWSLANPLLMIAVYSVAFTFILRVRGQGFVFYLMLGQLSWTLFASSAAMSTGSLVDNSGLLKSVHFPRAILPIGTVLFNLAQFILTISVFLPVMMLWYRVPLSAPMLLFPLFLLLQVMFTMGIALILSTSTAFFRDVRHLLEVALAMLFWSTPIVYELSQVPERLRFLILLSPVSPFVVAYHDIFFYLHWPDARIWIAAIAQGFITFFVGALMFLSLEDRVMEQL